MRLHLSTPVFSGAYSLMTSTALTGVLGIGFWAAAARLFPSSEVGRDSVLIAALTALSSICQLNMVDAIVRFLPGVAPDRWLGRIARAYGASALTAVVGGTAFVLVAPLAAPRLHFLASDTTLRVAFVASVVFWGVFTLQDAVLAALRRARWLPFENSAFSVAKIAALPVLLLAGSGHAVFLAWVVPAIVLVPIINRLLLTRVLRPAAGTREVSTTASAIPGRARLMRFLAQDYGGYVLGQSAYMLLPLIILQQMGSRANAYFAIPFSLILAFDLLFYGAATALTVEAARDFARAAELTRTIACRFLGLLVPAAALIALAAPVVLAPFGSAYAHNGAPTLRLLATASIFRTLVALSITVARLRVRGTTILIIQGTVSTIAVVLALAFVGPLGLSGVALAWLIANAAVAVIAIPGVWRFVRQPARSPVTRS